MYKLHIVCKRQCIFFAGGQIHVPDITAVGSMAGLPWPILDSPNLPAG